MQTPPWFSSKGIFAITSKGTYRDQGPEIFTTRSGVIRSHTTFSCLKKELRLDDYLVQPFMINHPILASLCNTLDAVTIRIITELQHSHPPAFFCAMLEIPMTDDEKNPECKAPFHIIVPIDPDTGEIRPFPGNLLNPSVRERYNRVYARMNNHTIPFWKEMYKNALDAHHQFKDVYGIAWDFVVTPDGAFLLEGNTGWGSKVPQRITGGLLRDGTPIK